MAENNTNLPHDLLAEQAVIGSIFVDPDKILIASEYLTKKVFTNYHTELSLESWKICRTRENQLTPCQSNQHLIQ